MPDFLETATGAAVILNMVSDIYFRAREAGVEITPENIRDHIAGLEEKAKANNEAMGIED